MPKLPRIKPAKLIKALERAGFYVDHITGSHYILYKNDKSFPVVVPFHNKDLKNRDIIRHIKTSQNFDCGNYYTTQKIKHHVKFAE
ncbi:MAG: type II toxin-antitoxin system HicA family toxin [bacterium]